MRTAVFRRVGFQPESAGAIRLDPDRPNALDDEDGYSVEPPAHRQRVNVPGALRHDGKLIWTTQQLIMGLLKKDDGWRLPDELWEQMEPLLRPVSRTRWEDITQG